MRVNTNASESDGGLFAPGFYDAVITTAEESQSNSGNDMIVINLRVYHQDGRTGTVRDWLLSNDNWQWKVRHCCESAGINYGPELNASDFVDRNVRVNLKISARDKNDKRPLDKMTPMEKQNSVVDYVLRTGAPTATALQRDPIDADIPF